MHAEERWIKCRMHFCLMWMLETLVARDRRANQEPADVMLPDCIPLAQFASFRLRRLFLHYYIKTHMILNQN
jgi:hypothetical protein